jgi:hypothetical protein
MLDMLHLVGSLLYLFLLLLLLALQPTVGFSLLSDSPTFRPFLTQLSPPSYITLPITPWPQSASELYRQNGRRRSAKVVPTVSG